MGYEENVDIFWGHSKTGLFLENHFYTFYSFFLRSRYRIGLFLGGSFNFEYFWGMSDVPYSFGVVVDAGSMPAYIYNSGDDGKLRISFLFVIFHQIYRPLVA